MDYLEWAEKFDPVPDPSGSLIWGREHYPELQKKASWDDTALWSVLPQGTSRSIIVAGLKLDAAGYMRTRFGRAFKRDYEVTLPDHLVQEESVTPLRQSDDSEDGDATQQQLDQLTILEEERLITGDLHHHHWMSHDH